MAPKLFVEFTQGVQGVHTHEVWLIPNRPLIIRVSVLGLSQAQLANGHVTVTVTSATSERTIASCTTPDQAGGPKPPTQGRLYLINRATKLTQPNKLSTARLDPDRTFNFLLDSASCSKGSIVVEVKCTNFGSTPMTNKRTIDFPSLPLTMPIRVVRYALPGITTPTKDEVRAQLMLLPLLFPIVNVALSDIERDRRKKWKVQPTFEELLGDMSELWNASTGLVLAAVGKEWEGPIVGSKSMSKNGCAVASAYTVAGGVNLAAHELAHQLGLPHAENSHYLNKDGRLERSGTPPVVDVVGGYLSSGAPLTLLVPQADDTRDYMYNALSDEKVPTRPDAGRWTSAWSHKEVYEALVGKAQARVTRSQQMAMLTLPMGSAQSSEIRAYVIAAGGVTPASLSVPRSSSTVVVLGRDQQPISEAVQCPDLIDAIVPISITVPLTVVDAVVGGVLLTQPDGTSRMFTVTDAGGPAPTQVNVSYEQNPDKHTLSATVTWSPSLPDQYVLVRFTPDDGETWLAVASGPFAVPRLTVDLTGCLRSVGSIGKFEVSAANGMPGAVSSGFRLIPSPNKMVIVTPPTDGDAIAEIHPGQAMLVSGAMLGPQTADAEPEDFHWSIEGGRGPRDLGTGREILVHAEDLGEGMNTLTLSGPDPAIPADIKISLTGVA